MPAEYSMGPNKQQLTLFANTLGKENTMSLIVEGLAIPDSMLAHEITEVVRDTATPLLFHHSSRVYYFGALAGRHRGLKFDPELLYSRAMFHDMGLTPRRKSAIERVEVIAETSL